MLDKYMIAHCAYTCDAKAKQLLKERLKADAEGRSGDSRILCQQREEYLYLKEYFLRFLRPTFRTYEFVVTTEDQWERYRPVELSVPCYHYVVGDIHIPLFLQDDELDIDVPLFSHSYTPENHAVEPLPDHVLQYMVSYLQGTWENEK